MQACVARIDDNLGLGGQRIAEYQDEIQKTHDHMWEARSDMDHIDKVAMRQSIDQMMRRPTSCAQQEKLKKLKKSPYLGRFNFVRERDGDARPCYVRVHDFRDEETGEAYVYDCGLRFQLSSTTTRPVVGNTRRPRERSMATSRSSGSSVSVTAGWNSCSYRA